MKPRKQFIILNELCDSGSGTYRASDPPFPPKCPITRIRRIECPIPFNPFQSLYAFILWNNRGVHLGPARRDPPPLELELELGNGGGNSDRGVFGADLVASTSSCRDR